MIDYSPWRGGDLSQYLHGGDQYLRPVIRSGTKHLESADNQCQTRNVCPGQTTGNVKQMTLPIIKNFHKKC